MSSKATVHDAVEEAAQRISDGLPAHFAPEVALVFASCSYGQDLENVVKEIRQQLPSVKRIFGCSVSISNLRTVDSPAVLHGCLHGAQLHAKAASSRV